MATREYETKTLWIGKYRGVDIESFTVRGITGEDIVRAAERVVPTGGQAIDSNLFNILLRQQMIAGAITEVDGVPVKGSCQASAAWSLRTREFVGRAFDYMNSVSDTEKDDFEKALTAKVAGDSAQENEPANSTPISSASGSGSPGI